MSLRTPQSVASVWLDPSPQPALGAAEVHVWRIGLAATTAQLDPLLDSLDPAERELAARFRDERDRLRFIVSHGARREILARYAKVAPHQLSFQTNPFGKPSLVKSAATPLTFNLSHSGDVALLAVASGREVGVDVEHVRPDVPIEQVARRFFSASEHEALNALTGGARYRGFFACWTRKEAYLKARGHGLTVPLNSFDVTVEFGQPPQLLSAHVGPGRADQWSLVDLPMGPNYAATLAVEGPDCLPRTWDWPG